MESIRDVVDGMSRDGVRGLLDERERRVMVVPLTEIEWRDSGSGDGSRILSGYAAVYDEPTTLYNGKFYRWDEVIQHGAFDAILATDPDVHFNLGHDMNRSMARTKAAGPIGKLELNSDAHGLRMYARLSATDPDVQALAAKMDLGIMDQCSFAFTMAGGVTKTETTTDADGKQTDLDTLVQIGDLFDTCVCARGAYPTTEAALRSLMESQGRAIAVPAEAPVRSEEVSEDASGAQGDPVVASKRSTLIAEGVVALASFKPRKEV
jgi:HK97 family phage prohead protease